MRRRTFNFNHISDTLSEDRIKELKSLYKNYHRLQVCYKWKYKKLRRIVLSLQMSSIGSTVTGTVVGSFTLNPIVIGCLTGSGILIQGYITRSNISDKVEKCKFAYTNYEKVCVQIKCFLRGLPSDDNAFLTDLKVLDDIIIDQCPTVDEYVKKYNDKYTD